MDSKFTDDLILLMDLMRKFSSLYNKMEDIISRLVGNLPCSQVQTLSTEDYE